MAPSSPELPHGDDRQPADEEHDSILPLLSTDPTDNAPTVISKHSPRPLTNDEALNGIRGRKLAHFELIDRIGVGGMAAVLRARDTQLDRIVALKILPPDMALDEENVRRFHQEARSAAKLDHENVARVFFCGEDQRLHFIAFEFVEGENLRTVLELRGRLPVGEALHYMLQIAAGLAHASQRGVVHRDIKPSNIIITPGGRAKLVDMGLARSLGSRHDDDGLTQSGVTLGTFDYISPEQALEPREADVRSDIYSLGCTFYHMLTGRPPVPEGTAARKLHHHQHIRPRDPREVVPGLPDDVAVILDRMLAKEPRDRYQTPQQLVHYLLAAARKVGVGGDVPEGVLAMDAVVPNPPRYRPVLFAVLATVAVVVLILVLGQGATTPPHNVALLGTPPAKSAKDKEPTEPDPTNPAVPANTVPPVVAVEKAKPAVYDNDDVTAADLLKWLKENAHADELDVRLARDLDDAGDLRLVFKAAKVSIRSKDLARPVTVRLTYDARHAAPAVPDRAAFTVDSKDGTVEGVCFLLDARGESEALVGLQCAAGGSYRVNRCQFVQANTPRQPDPKRGLASVVVDGNATGRTRLALSECCFLGFGELSKSQGESNQPNGILLHEADRGGYEAVVRRGPAQVEAANCAFGPHDTVFRLEGKRGPNELLVQHCSVLAGSRTTVFGLADDAGAALKVHFSLFSRPGEAAGERDGAVLVRQTAGTGAVTYDERDNRYHHLDAYWVGAVLPPKIPQDPSRELDTSPWKEEHPLGRLEALRFADPAAKAADPTVASQRLDQIKDAFQVNLTDRAAVQPLDRPLNLIGVEQLGGVSYVAKLREKEPVVARRERVVDPTVTGSRDGVYPTLSSAVEEAKPGDVILIKHTGDLAIKPVRVEAPVADLTFRPYPDYHPILVLGATADADVSLFRVYDGKLQFEGLEFRLEPKDRDFKVQTVAAVVGNGQCGFTNCVVTLDPAGLSTALAVAAVEDRGVMMMKSDPPSPRTQPRIAFDKCVVRGQGDLVWDRAGRPFDLEARNSLVVLAGNFLNVEVAAEAATTLVGATLANVTAYQTGHFIRLHVGKDVKGLPLLHFTTTSCLFVAAAGHSLIHLEGLEMTEDRLKDRLKDLWNVGENGNVYAGFGDMLDQRPRGEEMPQPAIGSKEWKTFTGEMTIKMPRAVKFASPPPPEGPFNRVAPAHFKATDLAGFGADVLTLPRPAQVSPDSE